MPRLAEELTGSFAAGMVDSAAPTAFPATAVAALYDGRIQPDGTAQRRPGNRRLSAAALFVGTGYGGQWFTTANGTDQLVAIFGDQAFYSDDYGATWGPCLDGSGDEVVGLKEDYYTFATLRVGTTNYLFAANGDTTIQRWSGAVWDTVPNAPSGVTFIAASNGRLVATGHSGVLVQASAIGDPETWASPDGWTIQVQQAPTGMFQVGPHLLVYGEDFTAYIDGYGQATLIVQTGTEGFSSSVGCVGFRTIVAIGDNAVCWLSKRGVEYYAPSSGITLLSKAVQQFMLTTDWTELYANPGRLTATYDSIEQNYWLAISTNGARNNRVLVVNLRQNAQWQRSGPQGACAIDVLLSPGGGDVFLGSTDGAYLDNVPRGSEVEGDVDGYLALSAGAGITLAGDVDGYLHAVTNDTLPATLFSGPTTDRATCIYSLGYDGYVRRHLGATKDDTLFDGSGGTDVTMTIVSRPFMLGRAKQRKRVREVYVSVVNAGAASVRVAVRGGGVEGPRHTLTFAATALNQSRRKRALVSMTADDPQVAAYVADDSKVSLIGVGAELLREPSR